MVQWVRSKLEHRITDSTNTKPRWPFNELPGFSLLALWLLTGSLCAYGNYALMDQELAGGTQRARRGTRDRTTVALEPLPGVLPADTLTRIRNAALAEGRDIRSGILGRRRASIGSGTRGLWIGR
jgi:hypothetical protein